MEHLIHEKAQVIDWAAGQGHVWTQGERWNAAGDLFLAPGQIVDVVGVEALRLRVKASAETGDAA
jgi:membrane-bound serine protease (ClpP class)